MNSIMMYKRFLDKLGMTNYSLSLLSYTPHTMKKLLFTMFYAITALVSLSTFLHGSDTYAAACPIEDPGCNDAIC